MGDELGWALAYDRGNASSFQDIQLINASSVLTSGAQGGVIQVQGQSLSLLDGSSVLANTLGDGTGQGIEVTVAEQIQVRGTTDDGTGRAGTLRFPSSILAEVDATATGNGGSILLTANQLHVRDLGQISTSTLGQGNAGDLTVEANRIVLSGANRDTASGLFSTVVNTDTTGNGGRIRIDAERLVVREGAQIQSSTFGIGRSGNIRISADMLRVIGVDDDNGDPSGIFAETENGTEGNGGNIAIRGDRLQLLDGGIISTSTFGSGAGGTLHIRVDDILLGDFQEIGNTDQLSAIVAVTQDGGGDGGNIIIEGDRLRILDGSLVSTNTSGGGDSGPIQIIAKTIELNGTNADGNESAISSTIQDSRGQGGSITIQAEHLQTMDAQISVSTFGVGDAGRLRLNIDHIQLVGQPGANTGIFSNVESNAEGNGGPIDITANRLVVQNSAQVVSATAGSGNAGLLRVRADEVVLDGETDSAASGIFASAIIADGSGGNIELDVNQLSLTNGAVISASNFFSRNVGVPPGQGSAGSITLQADDIRVSNGSEITTSTNSGDRGNIRIGSDRLFLTDQSRIETNANSTDGGNIVISADLILALNNSDITANANIGNGGQVWITAETLLGARVRDRLTRLSDITATSGNPALNGIVNINTPDSDVQPDAGRLPSTIVDIDQLVAQSCIRARAQGQFLITGRDALSHPPTTPSIFGFETYSMDIPFQSTESAVDSNTLRPEGIATNNGRKSPSLRIICTR